MYFLGVKTHSVVVGIRMVENPLYMAILVLILKYNTIHTIKCSNMGVLIIVKALLTACVLGNTFIVPRTAITSNVFQVFRKPFSVYMFKSFYLKTIMAGLKKTSSFQNSDNDN